MMNQAAKVLSPFVRSGIVLEEPDRELERRGHQDFRYADDCNIDVLSERAGSAGDDEESTLQMAVRPPSTASFAP
jgi:retron-type reverse transcriptase